MPSVYYGSEWGIRGRKEDGDQALRPAVNLEEISAAPPVPGLCEYITFLGKCRREYACLREGRYRELLLTNRQYAFARMNETEAVITAVNNDDKEAQMYIPMPVRPAVITDLISGSEIAVPEGNLAVTLKADGSALYALRW